MPGWSLKLVACDAGAALLLQSQCLRSPHYQYMGMTSSSCHGLALCDLL